MSLVQHEREIFYSRIEQVVPWKSLERKILIGRNSLPGGVGRPRTEVILLLKVLFLQGMYHLSDPEVEDQIRDRGSFQRFLGIREAKDVPDETVICRFRNELVSSGIQESIFTVTQAMLYVSSPRFFGQQFFALCKGVEC